MGSFGLVLRNLANQEIDTFMFTDPIFHLVSLLQYGF